MNVKKRLNNQKWLFVAVLSICIIAILIWIYLPRHISSDPVRQISLPSSAAERLGQNFVVGIPDTNLDTNTIAFLKHIQPAGIVLYARNYSSLDQITNLIASLQKIAKETTGKPYFIMIDEEPGGATRLNLFQNVFATGQPNWPQINHDVGTMRNIGINVDFAPVLDFPFDNNSFIDFRMPANTTSALISFDTQFIDLLHQDGIAATLKHFPGMGIFEVDPHQALPQSTIDNDILAQSLDIFQKGINDGADFVMTAHAVYDNVDPNNPATLSSKIIEGLLRERLSFKGLVITDDLSDMPFILDKKMDLTQATIDAIRNGQNLVLFSHKNEATQKIFDSIILSMKDDKELDSVVSDNYSKIVSFKDLFLGGSR